MKTKMIVLATIVAALASASAVADNYSGIRKAKQNYLASKVYVTRHCNLELGALVPGPHSCAASSFAQIGSPCTCTINGKTIGGVVGR